MTQQTKKTTAQKSNNTMSEIMREIQNFRDQLHSSKMKIMAKDFSCVVYLYENRLNQPCAIAYKGRAKKPAFNYRYSTEERRAQAVADWMKTVQETKKTRRKAEARTLEVGDVLRSSWGYEQTNIDYYLVTKLIGKTMVEIVEIGKTREGTEYLQGVCIPDKKHIIGETMRKIAQGDGVNISSFQWAKKIEPTVVAGTEIYNADHWTAYH